MQGVEIKVYGDCMNRKPWSISWLQLAVSSWKEIEIVHNFLKWSVKIQHSVLWSTDSRKVIFPYMCEDSLPTFVEVLLISEDKKWEVAIVSDRTVLQE